jgi:hypothetical protein
MLLALSLNDVINVFPNLTGDDTGSARCLTCWQGGTKGCEYIVDSLENDKADKVGALAETGNRLFSKLLFNSALFCTHSEAFKYTSLSRRVGHALPVTNSSWADA